MVQCLGNLNCYLLKNRYLKSNDLTLSSFSGASPWRTATSSTASTTASATRTLCDSKESVPNLDLSSPDPVISRIRRDFERKQEFLRTTNLPNYLGSPTHPQQPASAVASVHARTAPPPPPHAGRCSINDFQ